MGSLAPTGLAQQGTSTNGGTIEIAGTGDASGDTIKLYNGATLVGSGTVGVGGAFDITTTATFADGTYHLTATDTSADGTQTSTASTAATAIVGSLAPTGLAQQGTSTNGGTIEIAGTGDASGDTIKLYNGATLVGSGVAGAGGAFDFATTATFADGTYHLTATDTSADGTETSAQSTAATAVVGSLAPTSLAQKGTSTNGGTIDITGTGDASGDTIKLYNGATLVGSGVAGAGGAFDFATTVTFADGTYHLTAVDTSADGTETSTASTAATAIVASVAPTGLAQQGTSTNGGTIEIAGTGDASGDTIKLYNGATLVGSGVAGAGGAFDFATTATFADGTYHLTATDTSADGTETSTASTAATAIVGSLAPTGLAQQGTSTNGGTIEIAGTGDASGDTIKLYNGATLVGSGVAGAGGAFDFATTATFADGTYHLTATDTSADGTQTSANSSPLTVNVNPSAPTVAVLVGQPLNGGTVELKGTGEVGDTVDLYADGNTTTIVGTGTVGAGGAFDITTTATFADGLHTFTATETNSAHLTSASSSAFAVDVDPRAPVIATVVGTPLTNQTVELQGTGEAGDTVDLYADGNATTIVGTGTVGAGGAFDIVTTATFGDGTHTFTATETDAASLTSTASSPSFTVDVVHEAPTLTVGGAVTFIQNGSPVALDAGLGVSDVDSGGLLTGATVKITSGLLTGDTVNFVNQNGITGSYDAADGTLTLTGAASISNYKAALASVTFSSTSINPTNFGADLTRTVSWTATDGDASNGTSATATSTVDIQAVPTIVAGADVNYRAVLDLPVSLDQSIGVYDGANLKNATVSVASGFTLGDLLTADTGGTNIHASYNALNGVLTLTGNDTLAHYDQVLQSIKFSSIQTSGGTVAIDWQITDQNNQASAVATSQVNVTGIFGAILVDKGNPGPPSPSTGVSPPPVFFEVVTGVHTESGSGAFDEQGLDLGFGLGAQVYPVEADIDATVSDKRQVDFNVPLGSLEAALGHDIVSVTGQLADGRPLPSWLRFDVATGKFTGQVPADVSTGPASSDTLAIEIIARDSKGNISIIEFTINLKPDGKHAWISPLDGSIAPWAMEARHNLALIPGHDYHRATADQAAEFARPHASRGGAADGLAGRAGLSAQLAGLGWRGMHAERMALLESVQGAASGR